MAVFYMITASVMKELNIFRSSHFYIFTFFMDICCGIFYSILIINLF